MSKGNRSLIKVYPTLQGSRRNKPFLFTRSKNVNVNGEIYELLVVLRPEFDNDNFQTLTGHTLLLLEMTHYLSQRDEGHRHGLGINYFALASRDVG